MTDASWIMLFAIFTIIFGLKWAVRNADLFPGGNSDKYLIYEDMETNDGVLADEAGSAEGWCRWANGQWFQDGHEPQREWNEKETEGMR